MGLEKVIEKIQKEGKEKITQYPPRCGETSSPNPANQTKNGRGIVCKKETRD